MWEKEKKLPEKETRRKPVLPMNFEENTTKEERKNHP